MDVSEIIITVMTVVAIVGIVFIVIDMVKEYRRIKAEQKRRKEQCRDVIYAEAYANTADGTSIFLHIEDKEHRRYDLEIDYNLALGFIEHIASATRMADEARLKMISSRKQ